MDTNTNNENNQNSEVSSASMHDVPLTNEDQEDQVQGPIERIPSKSGSLKRFFKLTSNKSRISDVAINEKNTENDNADGNADAAGAVEGDEKQKKSKQTNEPTTEDEANEMSAKAQDLKRIRSRRFSFRFGGSTAEGDAPTSSNNVPSPSRHSLRSSFSTYFNSVFKRKQSANSKHTFRTSTSSKKKDDQQEGDNDGNSIEMVEQKHEAIDEKQKNEIDAALNNLNTPTDNKSMGLAIGEI